MKRNAITFAEQYLKKNVMVDDIKKDGGPTKKERRLVVKSLILSANDPDTNDYDTSISVAVEFLRENGTLPSWLATFVADVLEGKKKRPVKKGPDKYTNWERDYKLFRATQEVARIYGLQHYSNNELSNKDTAAEIVSLASDYKIDIVINAYKKFSRIGVK